MTASRRIGLSLVLAVTLGAGCTQPPPPPPPTFDITVDRASIVADGVSTATVSVAYSSDVRITTTQGKFRESNSNAFTIVGGTGSATLVSCDSRVTDPCGGTARLSGFAAADSATGSGSIVFKSLENCSNKADDDGNGQIDCADTACLGVQCALPTGSVGIGTCSPAGACQCFVDGGTGTPEVPETTCDDGKDNDCNGKVDCADTTGCNAKQCLLPGGGGVRGACAAGACKCPGVAENTDVTCKDGIDNDCDGTSDCGDTDCQPVGNNRGRVCDVLGNACSVLTSGVSTCTVCAGNGGLPEPGGETSCGDNKDNDCDGIIDCQDPDCGNRTCTATGKTCTPVVRTCDCPGLADGGTAEAVCNDNLDNDCDGTVDCADTDCRPGAVAGGASCGANSRRCNTAGACVCAPTGGTAEATEASCGDGVDNDCDGYIDCPDTNCRAVIPPNFTDGKSCANPTATPPRVGNKCDGAGVCICPGGQTAENICNDAVDNDCDGLTNCADSTCNAQPCDNNGRICGGNTCSICTGNGGTSETAETLCSDLRDNDCDGLVDCADPQCATLQCNTVSANYVCQNFICKDATSNFSLVLSASPTRIAANGTSTSAVTATLRNLSAPVSGATLEYGVSTGNGSVSPPASITNASGVGTTTFISSTQGGTATIQAGYDSGTAVIFGTVNVTQPRMGSIVVVSQTVSVMGVVFSGFNESNTILFQVNDELAQPYPAGLNVALTHQRLGAANLASYIGTPGTNCNATSCTVQAVTDASGRVSVVLHSGSAAGTVSVEAQASAGGVTQNASASNIAIVGAKAFGLNGSIICSPLNLPTYSNTNCSVSLYSGVDDRATCIGRFSDRFGNVLGRSTITTYSAESGAASAPSFTNNGASAGTVLMTGYSLPADVDAGVGEPAALYDDGCGPKVHNPRDGLSTIVVSAIGEEGFVDGNGNGTYDTGENFLDIGEPFVDANDNNVRDGSETYVDSNSNGAWDGPNGVWDSDTTIWFSTRVLYSGRAAKAVDGSGLNLLSRWYSLATSPLPPLPTAQPTFALGAQPPDGGTPVSTQFGVFFTDLNFNPPHRTAAYGLNVTPTGSATASYVTNPGTGAIDGLGMNFTQQFCSNQGGTAGCASSCNSSPCYMVTRIDNFSGGRYGVAQINSTATATGSITVGATCTLSGVITQVNVFGASQ